ncbi:MAG: hypothetical protein JWO15_3907 [Sphingomonadales bacterium]|nr:hypothetical protein [Sphingomonadales bacterium]
MTSWSLYQDEDIDGHSYRAESYHRRAGAAATPTIKQMRGNRRVLIVAAPLGNDARLVEQRHILTDWKQEAADRDVSVIKVVGDQVHGADDNALTLRRVRHLPIDRFAVILVGKDGHEAFRSFEPITGQVLSGRIDAMPMRRAGKR